MVLYSFTLLVQVNLLIMSINYNDSIDNGISHFCLLLILYSGSDFIFSILNDFPPEQLLDLLRVSHPFSVTRKVMIPDA